LSILFTCVEKLLYRCVLGGGIANPAAKWVAMAHVPERV